MPCRLAGVSVLSQVETAVQRARDLKAKAASAAEHAAAVEEGAREAAARRGEVQQRAADAQAAADTA